jgi:lysozyme family protein
MNSAMHLIALCLGTLKRELNPLDGQSRFEFNLQVVHGYGLRENQVNTPFDWFGENHKS